MVPDCASVFELHGHSSIPFVIINADSLALPNLNVSLLKQIKQNVIFKIYKFIITNGQRHLNLK